MYYFLYFYNMKKSEQIEFGITGEKGFSDYEKTFTNPFIDKVLINEGSKVRKVADFSNHGTLTLDNNSTVDIENIVLANETLYDKTEFVQLVNGDASFLLEKSVNCIKLFVYICKVMKFHDDKVIISRAIHKSVLNISEKGYYEGLRELLESEVIAKTVTADVYFINPNKIFKGKRTYLYKDLIKTGKRINQIKNVISNKG